VLPISTFMGLEAINREPGTGGPARPTCLTLIKTDAREAGSYDCPAGGFILDFQ
jgi:hypothetical protein